MVKVFWLVAKKNIWVPVENPRMYFGLWPKVDVCFLKEERRRRNDV